MSDLFLDPMYDTFDSLDEKIAYFVFNGLFNGVGHFIKTKYEKKGIWKKWKRKIVPKTDTNAINNVRNAKA